MEVETNLETATAPKEADKKQPVALVAEENNRKDAEKEDAEKEDAEKKEEEKEEDMLPPDLLRALGMLEQVSPPSGVPGCGSADGCVGSAENDHLVRLGHGEVVCTTCLSLCSV